jgi:hypothetical protein
LPPPFSFITAGITGALGAVEVATIAAQPLATGGIVGTNINGKAIKRSNGDNVLTTLKRGEVVLNERQQGMLGGSSTFAGIGVPGFAGGGLVTNSITPSLPSSFNSSSALNDSLALIKALDKKTDAISGMVARQEVVFTPDTQAAIDKDKTDKRQIRVQSTL